MPRAKPQHEYRKRRKPHVYLDPSRFTCTACRASFKSAAGLRQHYAQHRNCQSDSDSDADGPVENATFPDPSTSEAPPLTIEGSLLEVAPASVDQPDTAGVLIPSPTDPYSDAGDAEILDYSPDIGGGAWMSEPEPDREALNTLPTGSTSRSNTTIPSDPSRIGYVFEEQYPGAGRVIGRGITPFRHISSTPSYKDIKSSHQVSKACYPFKDLEEVEIVDWILRNRLSKASINDLVKTKYVSGILITTPESLIHIVQLSA